MKLHVKVDLNRTACGIRQDKHPEVEMTTPDVMLTYMSCSWLCCERCFKHSRSTVQKSM